MTQRFLEGLDLGVLVDELSLEFVDVGLGRSAFHSVGDLLCLAIE